MISPNRKLLADDASSAQTENETSPRRSRTFAVLVASLLIPSAVSLAAEPTWQVIASGLNNPRDLDFAPNGALYIAEAGLGGDGPKVTGADGELQFGLSGSVTRVWKGKQERIITGLPSLAAVDGTAAVGPSAINFGKSGQALFTIGLGLNPAIRSSVLGAPAQLMGTLQTLNQNGKLRTIADLAAFEAAQDPDGQGPDSNPNGVLNDKGGDAYAVDAGGNSLLRIAANGTISVVATFPNGITATPPFLPQPPFPPQLPYQAVPTKVVRGPDGALYVSQLTGFPFPVGAANIYRVVPGSAPTVYATGFTNVIDLEFDAAGNLYVLEIDANGLIAPSPMGRIAKVLASDHSVVTVASEGLIMPGGLTIGPDGALYVSNFSTSPAVGEVIRIDVTSNEVTKGKGKK